jgi:lipooligosaccharide transport system permease protein
MSAPTLTARVTPPALLGLKAHRVLERNLMVGRRNWILVLSGFFEPVFYLFSIGVGVGALVGDLDVGGRSISYAAFVAPALLASSAMNGAVFESTMNIFFKLKWGKVYDAMLATPLRPIDIAAGEIGYSLLRGGIYAVGFMVVMVAFGLAQSWWAIMAIPAALLIGFAFAAVGMAATTYMRSWQDFDLVQLVTLPLFLFSATFYPLDVYPEAIQMITRVSPLYHGVELIRAFTLGSFDWTLLGHAAFLVVMGAVGLMVAGRRLEGLLLK